MSQSKQRAERLMERQRLGTGFREDEEREHVHIDESVKDKVLDISDIFNESLEDEE